MKKVVMSILIILSITSCFKEVIVPYNVDFNNVRKKVGLRIIDSTFQVKKRILSDKNKSPIYRRLKNGPDMTSVNGTQKKYLGKNIILNSINGKIIYEEDIFLSGVSKRGLDNDIVEKIIFRYYFKKNSGTKEKWMFIHQYPIPFKGSSNYPNRKTFNLKIDTISNKKADSLLKAFNIKRLNY